VTVNTKSIELKKRMKRVRFYDDNRKYLMLDKQLARSVETIWVAPEPMLSRNGEPLTGKGAYVRFLRSADWDLRGEDRDLKDLLDWFGTGTEEERVHDGLNESHFQDLIMFANSLPSVANNAVRGVVIFDWDEVVNHTAGFRFHKSKTVEHNSPSAYLKYVIGTKRRLHSFRSCLNVLFSNRVAVHVATNNTGCGLDLFKAIVRELHPHIVVHCCNAYRKHVKATADPSMFVSNKSYCIELERIIPEHLREVPNGSSDCSGGFRNCVSLFGNSGQSE